MGRIRAGLVSSIWVSLLVVALFGAVLKVPVVDASDTFYIRADGSIDPPDAPVSTVDNVTYTLTGNIASDADGIVVERSSIIIDGAGCTVEGTETGTGFSLAADNVTVRNTYVQKFRYGIAVSSSGCTIISNIMTYNVKWGAYLGGSNNRIICNRIADTGLNLVGYDIVGIYVGYGSDNNTITDNHIEKNGYDGSGILLYHSSDNTITGNNITNHDYAGIYLDQSSGNSFYHNNFLNNYYQAYGSYSANTWDGGYPSGGNYWSDYTGVDEKSGPNQDEPGSDGIGDTSSSIGDRYPLMNPLGSPQPPIAIFTQFPQYAVIDEAVVFNASTSYDRDGSIINFEWDFGDGNVTTATTSVISHVYVALGTYSVNLTVTDNDGLTGSMLKSLEVKLNSSIVLNAEPKTVYLGSNVTISGTITPMRSGVNVTINISGPESDSVTVKTDSTGNYSYVWRPPWAGTYEINANWLGDDTAYPAESEIETVNVYEYIIYIRADGYIDPSTAPISTVDNITYTFMDDIYAPPIVVERSNIIVDGNGHTLEGLGYGIGFNLYLVSNVTITNINIKSFDLGIVLWCSCGNTITNNNVTGIGRGVGLVYDSNGNNIIGNTITISGISSGYLYSYVLYLDDSHNNTILNNTISGGGTGILVGSPWSYGPSSQNIIADNNVANNEIGIWVAYLCGSNNITYNYGGSMILSITSTGGNTLKSNNLTGLSIEWGSLSDYLLQEIDVSNRVNGKPIYYLINQTNLVIDPSTFPQIGYLALVNSENITVKHLTLTDGGQGILFAYTSNSSIESVRIANSLDGIQLVSSGNTISDNEVTNSSVSISTWGSYNIFSRNNITNNGNGISVLGSYNILLENNITGSSGSGISASGSHTIISRNSITKNAYGISMGSSGSQNNTVYENNIANNSVGIYVYDNSFGEIYHNNFKDNTQQLVGGDVLDDGYPSGGNYWSDYAGGDLYSGSYQNETGNDGIGDTPWYGDRYPLMNPWGSPQPPIAIFEQSQQYAIVDEAVFFDGSASGDRDGFITSYTWDFGDGSILTVPNPLVSHVYATKGNYTLKLTVTDNSGLSHSVTKFQTVKVYRSAITISVDQALLAFGSNFTIDGAISPTRSNVDVTLFCRLYGETWETLAVVQTNLDSTYSCIWQVPGIGGYDVKASWSGNEDTWPAESETISVATRVAIKLDGSVDPSNAPIQRDGDLYSFTGNIFTAVVVERDNIVIDGGGYTVQGVGVGQGIILSYRSNVTVKNIKVIGFEHGIYLYFSSPSAILPGNTLANSTIRDNVYGISLYYSSYNIISNNTITNNNYGIGIYSGGWDYYSDSNLVENSEISNNAESGIYLGGHQAGSLIEGNRLMQNRNGVSGGGSVGGVGIVNNVFESEENGIYLPAADIWGLDVVNNTVLSNGNGIYLYFDGSGDADLYSVRIANNLVRANGKGICIYAKSYSYISSSYGSGSASVDINAVSVVNNSVTSGGDGIQLYAYGCLYYAYYSVYGGAANIFNTEISNNSVSSLENGISLSALGYGYTEVQSTEVLNNSVSSAGEGIYIYTYTYATVYIEYMTITANSVSSGETGIYVYAYASSYGTLYGGGQSRAIIYGIDILNNLIWSNSDGIYLYTYAYAYIDLYTLGEIARAQISTVNILGNSLSFNGNGILLYAYAYASSSDGYVWAYCSIDYATIQPVAQFSYTPEHPLLGDAVVFNASASYGTIANYTWDFGDGNITTVTDPVIVHTYVAEGLYTVTLTVTDNSGYTENETKTMTVDVTPPTTLNDYDGSWHTTDFTINLAASDNISDVAEIYYRINDGPIQNVSTHGQPLITTEGSNNKLEYWSVDNAGNEESHHILTEIKSDKTYPTVETPSRTPDGYVSPDQSVKVSVNVTDATSQVKNVTLSYTINDGETWTDLPMTHTVSDFYEATIPGQEAGATVRFKIVAYDHAGNNATLDGTQPYSVYKVVPEFPSFLVLPLFMIAALLAVIVYKRKRTSKMNGR